MDEILSVFWPVIVEHGRLVKSPSLRAYCKEYTCMICTLIFVRMCETPEKCNL